MSNKKNLLENNENLSPKQQAKTKNKNASNTKNSKKKKTNTKKSSNSKSNNTKKATNSKNKTQSSKNESSSKVDLENTTQNKNTEKEIDTASKEELKEASKVEETPKPNANDVSDDVSLVSDAKKEDDKKDTFNIKSSLYAGKKKLRKLKRTVYINVQKPIKKLKQKKEENSISEENGKKIISNYHPSKSFEIIKKGSSDILPIFTLLLVITISIFLLAFTVFTIYNAFNSNIISGVYIKGIDVSGVSPSDAKYQLDNQLNSSLPEEIKLKHEDFETTISIAQMDVAFDTRAAANSAYEIGRQGNVFENNLYVLSTLFGNINIEPNVILDDSSLEKNLEDISPQLPDKVTQSSYYIEGSELIITSGKEGCVVDAKATIDAIKQAISSLSWDTPVEIVVKTEQPEKIDLGKIHDEVYKEPVDARYTTEPRMVYPSENGVEFAISVEEAQAKVDSEAKDEYSIPLKISVPSFTTNMIGTEAFPDLLSEFSTRYVSNANRTTNLVLAANKINGTVLMPGETFSYNKVVGARTIAAGYKDAAIYVKGEVVDGLGGGICQITSTLYNAAVYANLEITQRTNHQFVPSYVTASRDATVVYGALDFQFKNNRNYPIKLVCSVSGGIANFKIFGLHQEDDCQVEIKSYETGRSAKAIYSEAYKILRRDGQVVDKVLLSKDTYKRH